MCVTFSQRDISAIKTLGLKEVQSRVTIVINSFNRGIFFSTRKSLNTLFYPTPSIQTTLIACLGYGLICRLFNLMSKFLYFFFQKCKHWGIGEMLPLLSNTEFGSFSENRYPNLIFSPGKRLFSSYLQVLGSVWNGSGFPVLQFCDDRVKTVVGVQVLLGKVQTRYWQLGAQSACNAGALIVDHYNFPLT